MGSMGMCRLSDNIQVDYRIRDMFENLIFNMHGYWFICSYSYIYVMCYYIMSAITYMDIYVGDKSLT